MKSGGLRARHTRLRATFSAWLRHPLSSLKKHSEIHASSRHNLTNSGCRHHLGLRFDPKINLRLCLREEINASLPRTLSGRGRRSQMGSGRPRLNEFAQRPMAQRPMTQRPMAQRPMAKDQWLKDQWRAICFAGNCWGCMNEWMNAVNASTKRAQTCMHDGLDGGT